MMKLIRKSSSAPNDSGLNISLVSSTNKRYINIKINLNINIKLL